MKNFIDDYALPLAMGSVAVSLAFVLLSIGIMFIKAALTGGCLQ